MTVKIENVLGEVVETNGMRVVCRFDRSALVAARARVEGDELAASSVGGLIKIALADRLVVATLGDLAEDRADPVKVLAEAEYVGEGAADARRPAGRIQTRDRRLSAARRSGCAGCAGRLPADFRAAAGMPHIFLGTVHPTAHVRAPVLFDRLLGRHFAVVGSSGTGKSTTVSLLLHRIIEHAPHAHVVILDPHGEYAHAFGDKARVWDVSNLQLPDWAMKFLAEHAEAFVSTSDEEAVVDRNILNKCLQRARARNVRLSEAAKVTADSPIPYHLADLTGAIDEEAGRAGKARRCLALHPAAAQPGALLQATSGSEFTSTPPSGRQHAGKAAR